jgi:hypothetical protein
MRIRCIKVQQKQAKKHPKKKLSTIVKVNGFLPIRTRMGAHAGFL